MANCIHGSFISSLIEKLQAANPNALNELLKESGGEVISALFNSQAAIGKALGTGVLDKIDPGISSELGWISTALSDIGVSIMYINDIDREYRTIK